MRPETCPPGLSVPWARCRCRAPLNAAGTACTGAARHPVAPPSLRYYATWTSTRRNLGELHARGMRLITGPDQLSRYAGEVPPLSWGLDNGAWGCFQRGEPFDGAAFRRALSLWGEHADWLAVPDVVADRVASLALTAAWYDEIAATGRPLVVVQDGMTPADVESYIARGAGLFVGGSTAWKESSLAMWGAVKRASGCYLHVGRVNTSRRMQLAIDAGADSADGTSITRFGATARRLDDASRAEPRGELFGVRS